jgi:hypothetical protein
MPKRRDILAIVLIVLPWTLLITVWHQSAIAPLLAIRKGMQIPPSCIPPGSLHIGEIEPHDMPTMAILKNRCLLGIC